MCNKMYNFCHTAIVASSSYNFYEGDLFSKLNVKEQGILLRT